MLFAGITLSKSQVKRGNQLALEQGLHNCSFQVMDALHMDFPDDSFDLVWACESGEHMPDKKAYVEEMTRVLKPGQKQCSVDLMLCSWHAMSWQWWVTESVGTSCGHRSYQPHADDQDTISTNPKQLACRPCFSPRLCSMPAITVQTWNKLTAIFPEP